MAKRLGVASLVALALVLGVGAALGFGVTPLPGAERLPAVATLAPQSPDLMATGRRTPVSGKRITVVRVEMFALLRPAQGPVSVLGLSDSPVTVTAA